MLKKSFKEYLVLKESGSDWKSESLGAPLAKGFVPPMNMRPIIKCFLNSDKIILSKNTGEAKHVTMPKKSLYLVGGAPRDFISGKSVKDYDLATSASPSQIALILSAGGFKRAGDRSGKGGEELNIPQHFENEDGPQEVKDAQQGDSKTWFIKGRDSSKERKPFVISAVVNGDEFEIATFRKDAKVTDGQASVEFVDDLKVDSGRRDFGINSMYIELTSPDGENKKLYDPNGGMHDLKNGIVKTVGKAEDRFKEDYLRILRAIRMHCRYGKGEELHEDIKKAIPKFLDLDEHVSLERIREEFLKGLLHPEIDPKKYLNIYYKSKLLHVVFPGIKFTPSSEIPPEFSSHQDKALSLAFLLQHNPVDKVAQVLGASRSVAGENKPTGWQNEEKNAVIFLLKLKEFTPDKVSEYLKGRAGTGLSNRQIKEWVDLFKIGETNRDKRPWWSRHVKAFADHTRSVGWEHAVSSGENKCKSCKGSGCMYCHGTGEVAPEERSKILAKLEADKFKEKLGQKE